MNEPPIWTAADTEPRRERTTADDLLWFSHLRGWEIEDMAERPTLHTVLELFENQVSGDAKSWIESACTSKKLTRDSFFEAAYWAILVANMNVVTAQSWVDKAQACGFPRDWRELGDWNDDDGKFDGWCKKMAKELVNPKEDLDGVFRSRWWGIWDIGWRLAQFESDAAFAEHYFGGKKHGRDLTDEDIHRLARIKRTEGALYRIGKVSIYFILRNLGGNFLKPDTWINAFADWFGCESVSQLCVNARICRHSLRQVRCLLLGVLQQPSQPS